MTNGEGGDIFVINGCLTATKKEDATIYCCILFDMFTLNLLN